MRLNYNNKFTKKIALPVLLRELNISVSDGNMEDNKNFFTIFQTLYTVDGRPRQFRIKVVQLKLSEIALGGFLTIVHLKGLALA